jgi:glutathione peroxidase
LQELHDKFGSRGLRILAFPSNDFAQEFSPDEPEKIKKWANSRKYTMDFFQPIHVNNMLQKPYEKSHPIFWYMKRQQPKPVECIKEAKVNDCPATQKTYTEESKEYSKRVKRESEHPKPITWNFEKFVIDKRGKVVMNYDTSCHPISSKRKDGGPSLAKYIEDMFNKKYY